jgi:hypothetical protein
MGGYFLPDSSSPSAGGLERYFLCPHQMQVSNWIGWHMKPDGAHETGVYDALLHL